MVKIAKQNTPEKGLDREIMLLVILAICSSFSPVSVDFFAPSVPDAARAFDVSMSKFQLSIYAFFSGFALASLLWGSIADRSGRYGALVLGMGVYIVASILCSQTDNIEVFALWRFLQGTGAAAGSVISRAILRDIYGADGITVAVSKLLAIMVWIPALSPVIGGTLSWYSDWRVSFLIMGGVGMLALAGVYLLVPRTTVIKSDTVALASSGGWWAIVLNRQFLRNALSNMFVMGTIVLFMSHYAHLTESYYDYKSINNGGVLTAFSMTIFVGIFLVKYLVRIGTTEQIIYAGALSCIAGWLILLVCSYGKLPHPVWLILPAILACLGMGVVYSLSGGQALIPFAHNAGRASALFMFLQSAGVALIVFLGALTGVDDIASLAGLMLLCALFSITCRILLRSN